MRWRRGLICALAVLFGLATVWLAVPIPSGSLWAAQATSGVVVRSIGTVQTIQGKAITLRTDSGTEVHALIQGSTRMLRIQPGQKNLSGATPLQLQDLQVGDRILIMGTAEAGQPLLASSLIAIKRTDLAREQQTEQMEWEKNGVGGLVQTVDPAAGTVTVKARVEGIPKTITIHTSPTTSLLRYAPGSVRFEDAKPGPFAEIKPGDQLRARGTFSADGTSLNAAQVVSGSFRNIAGAVVAVDTGANQITVMDRIAKGPVTVKITPDSQLRQLPQATAQKIALDLRGVPGAGQHTGGQASQPAGRPMVANNGAGSSPPSAPPKVQQRFSEILSSLPAITVSDLSKGDVVMIVATEGATSGSATAIKLISGASPILTTSPGGSQSSAMQSLWSGFGASGGEGGAGASGGGEQSASSPQ